MRLLQTVLLSLLLALLLLVTVLGIVRLGNHVAWSLTPLGFALLSAPLFALGAVSLFSRPRNLLVVCVSVATLVALGPVIDLDAPRQFPLPALLVLAAGLIALLVGLIVGNHGRRARSLTLVEVVTVLALSATLGVSLLAGFSALVASKEHLGPRSPGGTWQLVGRDTYGFGPDSGVAEVYVRRDIAGLFREQRRIYISDYWGPRMGWLGSSTVVLDGKRVNIFRSPPIDLSQ